MITLQEDGKNYRFFKFIIRFLDVGVERVVYTDNLTPTLMLVEEFPERYNIISYGEFKPESSFVSRLAKVNSLNLAQPDNYYDDLRKYVELGIMTNKSTELSELFVSSEVTTRKFLIDLLTPEVQAARDSKIAEGVILNGIKYKANGETKVNLLTYIMSGREDTEVITWKDFDGVHQELTILQLKELLKKVSKLLETAFEAEKLVMDQLAGLTIDALTDFKTTSKYSRLGKSILEVKVMDINSIYDHHYDMVNSGKND